ncbi:glycosyltransferase family 39 protein [uncultured Celeribacter sp.]|uniref:ArnT family glycosyltransferase n=1 Tax=uncultured Celeribacter sp. TaxID=1303376 RepID=UPI002AA735A2|nr:glycosyltransferase family 39 protein [uncultured Celeribacter sp.]
MTRLPTAPSANASATQRVTVAFVLIVTVYFLAQMALRMILGGALETDEAEMLLMTPGLRWGYGPQLPLYNWLQTALFAVFGETLFALSLLKNLLLWLTYMFVFLGLRAFVPARIAALSALSLFLIPDIAWEAQRATTHSNMLLATIAASIAAWLWALKTGHWRAWALLGLAMGLGGIAKYNFWAIPAGLFLASLTLPQSRRRVLTPQALIAPLITVLIVAGPYLWMMNNPDLSLSSVGKIAIDQEADHLIPKGVSLYLEGLAILSILPALVAVALRLASRTSSTRVETNWVVSLFLRSFLFLAVTGGIVVWLADVGHITPRWLLPVVLPLVIGAFLWLTPRLSHGATIGYLVTLGLFAALVFTGLSMDRYKAGARRDLDFMPLVTQIEGMDLPQGTLIVADFYIGGNLARIRPDWTIHPDLPASAREEAATDILLLGRLVTSDPELKQLAATVGWPLAQQAEYDKGEKIELPFHHSDRMLLLHMLRGTAN